MFLMIDNYDSFVYNLARYFEELGESISVKRNDKISLNDIKSMALKGIVISPGPKRPENAGISLEIIREFKGRVPILGICLGFQAICHVFGGRIIKGTEPMHGKVSEITHDGKGIFHNVKCPLKVTRYHSLIAERESIPDCLEITSETKDGVVMGVRHRHYAVEGVQFHPEAELTECGHRMLKNFISLCEKNRDGAYGYND